MTFPEDLSPEAKHLLRTARGGDRAQRSEVSASVQRFRQSRAEHRQPQRYGFFVSRNTRRATPWAIVAAILSGTLGAYATVGQSLGLPVPGWWPEFTAWAPVDTATAPKLQSRGPQGRTKPEAQTATLGSVGHTATPNAVNAPPVFDETAPDAEHEAAPHEPVAAPLPALVDGLPGNHASSSTPVGGKVPSRATTTRAPLPDETRAERAPDAVPPETPSVATSGPLAREVQVITAARDALNAGNYPLAKRHLDAHGLEFPKGSLSEERQALSAICECRTGGGSDAAHRYVSRRPETPLTRRVAKECGLKTER